MSRPIYLDYAATTPVDPRVVGTLLRFLTPDGEFGNAGSTSHDYGRAAAAAVDRARAQVAALLNAEPREIVWTSGATESINLALKGAARAARRKGRHIVTWKTEHKAVLDVCRELEREGFKVSYLTPRGDGLIDLDGLAAALRPDTVLLSLMHVNNETGVAQDLAAVGRLTRARGVVFHVDAAQSAGKLPLDVAAAEIDLLSLCGHKIYAPKGVGALYVRRRPKVRLQALLHGGGQERGLRAGTLAVHQIAALGEALALAQAAMPAETERIVRLRERLWAGLVELGGVARHGGRRHTAGGILNVSFSAISAEALLLDLHGRVAASAGSACTSASQEPSHVLRALGVSDEQADSAVRFSLGRFSTEAEVDRALAAIGEAVRRLRALSPLGSVPGSALTFSVRR